MPSDKLSPASITDNLKTRIIGKKVIYYPHLPSTMDAARQEAQQGAAEGTVIIAGEQTEGRGRARRIWMSPKGNVALSLILHPDISWLPRLIMLASLAVVHSIEAVTCLKPQIKWPNDILINGKKVGGILIENEMKGTGVAYAIIGIGVNVSLKAADISVISALATSLNDELGKSVSPVALVRHLLVELERLYLTPLNMESIYTAWRDRLVTLGKKVSLESSYHLLEGIAESVDVSGALRVRYSDGSSTVVVAGDVTLRDKPE